MTLAKEKVQAKYGSGARYYDLYMWLYRLLGFRIEAYRSRAIKLLDLQKGDRVVELGCGTGLNFPRIIEQIGPQGRLIGVDLTPEMLVCAQERIERSGWKNVELIQSDIVEYDLPDGINKVLSTGVFGFVADYDRVIETVSHALAPGGRLVIMDGKHPEHWPSWLLKLFVCIGRPFGLTFDYIKRRPWESVERCFQQTALEQMYGGVIYISSGTAPSTND